MKHVRCGSEISDIAQVKVEFGLRIDFSSGRSVDGSVGSGLPVAKHPSPDASSVHPGAAGASAGMERSFAFDVYRERPVTASSSSVSPPPSSAGQSSTMSGMTMPPYAYYPPPPWAAYPYGYAMPYMAPYYAPMPPPQPQQPPVAGRDGNEQGAGVPMQAWMPTSQMYKVCLYIMIQLSG